MKDESNILKAWKENGQAWISIIDQNQISSRGITNKALLNSILSLNPNTLLDMGCGEGWLGRSLTNFDIQYTGIDGVAVLIENAKSKGNQKFLHFSFEDFINKEVSLESKFDLIVFNYSLFGKHNTQEILINILPFLELGGSILIQTIHPKNKAYTNQKESDWVEEKWTSIEEDCSAFSWYFRTQEEWNELFTSCQLKKFHAINTIKDGQEFSVIYQLKTEAHLDK